mmetsp:Transcript_1185/g.3462  ORF Transcript_1185/g.3462 Transcript_1185/m.3462 type:complete len:281 (-) Transcript_1185:406-1248(-)
MPVGSKGAAREPSLVRAAGGPFSEVTQHLDTTARSAADFELGPIQRPSQGESQLVLVRRLPPDLVQSSSSSRPALRSSLHAKPHLPSAVQVVEKLAPRQLAVCVGPCLLHVVPERWRAPAARLGAVASLDHPTLLTLVPLLLLAATDCTAALWANVPASSLARLGPPRTVVVEAVDAVAKRQEELGLLRLPGDHQVLLGFQNPETLAAFFALADQDPPDRPGIRVVPQLHHEAAQVNCAVPAVHQLDPVRSARSVAVLHLVDFHAPELSRVLRAWRGRRR